ncbi:hypothetical protein LL974_02160 [Xanthomonas campestris pv. cannae]|nr:hypothetical protein [Xanthomonas campestris pv. cannae]
MDDVGSRAALLLSLQRGLLGEVHPQLRQASIEADRARRVVRLRFEYDGPPMEAPHASCSRAATEVIADFPAGWNLEEAHVAVPMLAPLQALQHVAYRRAEADHSA